MNDGRQELHAAMTGSLNWQPRRAADHDGTHRVTRVINIGVVTACLLGLAAIVLYAPRAGAAVEALQEPPSPRTHQLWACAGETSCTPIGRPMGATACQLDAASLANTLPKGSRVACERVKR